MTTRKRKPAKPEIDALAGSALRALFAALIDVRTLPGRPFSFRLELQGTGEKGCGVLCEFDTGQLVTPTIAVNGKGVEWGFESVEGAVRRFLELVTPEGREC